LVAMLSTKIKPRPGREPGAPDCIADDRAPLGVIGDVAVDKEGSLYSHRLYQKRG
jgi:hypothetical protein